jgi:hypothetical protein
MIKQQILRNGFLGALGLILSALPFSAVLAHGGAAGTDTDQCKIEIQGEWVHYTAYQPFKSAGTEFCENIPELNTPTNLVFDYIGSKLRKMQVEFEITKEPEGTRIYYQEASAHQTGTINATVTFKEKGKYLIHVKLIPDTGEPVDAHIGFSVGGGAKTSMGMIGIYLLFLLGALYILYLSNAGFKSKVDELLKKAKDA